MAWMTPKLDWTSEDDINAPDWNRIENNTREVVDFLNSIQYPAPAITTITTRTKAHVDYLRDINRIEQNLEAIRAAFVTPPGYLGAKTWTVGKGFTHEDAIRLEQNVKQLMEYGVLVVESFVYCGAWTSGIERGMI